MSSERTSAWIFIAHALFLYFEFMDNRERQSALLVWDGNCFLFLTQHGNVVPWAVHPHPLVQGYLFMHDDFCFVAANSAVKV